MAAEGECWSQTPEVRRLFPTFVWKAQLRPEVYEPLNALILGRLEAMRRERPPLQQGETWQSKHGLHGLPEFRSLVSCIHTAAEGVLEFLRIGSSELRITGCWANVSAPGGGHRTHTHPNNFLSGVYYGQVRLRTGKKLVEVDSRPSDAIALRIATMVPIFVAEHVLEEVAD